MLAGSLLSGAPAALAQFQLPSASRLTYQYGYGVESAIEYRRDRDIDRRLRDAEKNIVAVKNITAPSELRRLGLDARAGWFKPGHPFLRNEGDEENPLIRKAHRGFALVAKIWW